MLFRPFPTRLFKKWRNLLLKLCGAKIQWTSHVYASVKICTPWNLELGEYSTLGPHVDCYNQFLNKPKDELFLLYLSNLMEEKGILDFLDSLILLKKILILKLI